MAELRLERHPALVEHDLPDIYAFIARDNPAAAERVLDGVEDAFRQLARHPESGAPSEVERTKGSRSEITWIGGIVPPSLRH